MTAMQLGDYVIVSHPDDTTDPTYRHETFKIVGFTINLFGAPLVRVVRIDGPSDAIPTVFFPRELSFEDGTRPDSISHPVSKA